MIDRSYLPFQSAREYQDRGMMKWMGFFLSEHTTSLDEEKHKVKFLDELSLLDKVTLISQLYAGQLMAQFMIKKDNQKITYLGQVTELFNSVTCPRQVTELFKGEIVIKTRDQFQSIAVEDILDIQLVEEGVENEQTRTL